MLFWIQYSLALLFSDEDRFDDANVHIEHAKLHAANDNDTYLLARAIWLQVWFWHKQHRFEGAKSEALRALDAFEKLGVADGVEGVREHLRRIDHDSQANVTPRELDDDGKVLTTVLFVVFIDSS